MEFNSPAFTLFLTKGNIFIAEDWAEIEDLYRQQYFFIKKFSTGSKNN